jgi:outer membrane protein TolC
MSITKSGPGRCLAILIGLCAVIPARAAEESIDLAQAEVIAVERDAALAVFGDKHDALMQSAIAESQLPDPQMRLAAQNFPTDSFDRDQEAMTQLIVGVRQAFPRGKSRHISRQKAETMASAEVALADDRRREVVHAVRLAWIEKAYLDGADATLAEQRIWFDRLEDAALASYASGARSQHELIRIAMEKDLLEEEAVRLQQAMLDQQAELARWLGSDASRVTIDGLPTLPSPPPRENAEVALSAHPLIAADLAVVGASELGVSLAEQSYRPGWALDLSYGFRDGRDNDGDSRPDFFSAMVLFDVPIFTKDRQDRRLAAASAGERQSRNRLRDRQRILRSRLDGNWSTWQRTRDRIDLFQDKVLPAAEANIEATRQAYRNDLVPIDEVVDAEKTLLQTRTRLLRIRADHARAQSGLLYLLGENR